MPKCSPSLPIVSPASLINLVDPSSQQVQEHEWDAAISVNVLEHLRADLTALHDLVEVVHSGGNVIVAVPVGPSLFSSLDRAYRYHSVRSLVDLIQCSGVTILHIQNIRALGIAD